MTRKRDAGPPSTGAAEKDVLLGFLGYLRDAVAAKAEGVPEPQVRTPGVPSGTSLLGLVKHLTHVEAHWLLGKPVKNWQATFRPAPAETADDLLDAYRETAARADEVIDGWDDLGAPGPRRASRRWTLTHLIEETGRHAGHADILRELLDGTTGR
ncbi:DinB family protein [Amycolatopsis sp., V23-08]|uniref:DinB family protein n=1 Tax=Amycolatopsis heterodermiae TaxID=3110235 RepID=A0ABU5R2W9_9PSEU|nr:DinB family protein [Amycolatopsis sp., V23-08]MEA5360556.1 DinB family protein [Amycolatopsis sp., V23-08]